VFTLIAPLSVCIERDTNRDKPKWVYLDEEQVTKLADNAKYEYKVLIWFLLDTGIRFPSELINIKVSDIQNNFKELNIKNFWKKNKTHALFRISSEIY